MRRIVYISLLLLAGLCGSAAYAQSVEGLQDVDPAPDTRYAGLDSLLTRFYLSMERESIEAKNAEFDSLIGTCRDSLTRQHVALAVFDHYRYSRVMGEEAVAIHIWDEWIASGKVRTRGEFEQMDDEIFVDFNRRSLIGMTAEPVTLRKPFGKMTVPVRGRISVLFFHDTQCAKCRLEAVLLPQILESVVFPMDLYAVYVGDDRREWKAFRRNFRIPNRKVRLYNLWDPEMDSDYARNYAVTATPRMYMIWDDGEIIGRRLEAGSLQEMISYINSINGIKKEARKSEIPEG